MHSAKERHSIFMMVCQRYILTSGKALLHVITLEKLIAYLGLQQLFIKACQQLLHYELPAAIAVFGHVVLIQNMPQFTLPQQPQLI